MKKGAKPIFGSLDYKIQDSSLNKGNYFYPMVLEDIPRDSPAYKEELFGPVFSLFKVKNEQEAI